MNVNVEAPDPGAAIDAGLKAALTPVGRPVADSATAALNPLATAIVMVVVTLAPSRAETEAGLAVSEKAGVDVKVKHCVRLPRAALPSRGGNGAPLVELLVVGVLVSKL